MKRILASIGIGGATVDTVFPRAKCSPGDTVTADVELYGGETTQEIEGIYFDLKTRLSEGADDERVIGEFTVDETITLSPDEEQTIPADIHLPRWAPLTQNAVSVWVETGLDIDWAKDPTDEDQIEIVPDEYTATLFTAVEELGFALQGSTLSETPYLDDRPFAQKFAFRPTESQFAPDLDDLRLTIMPRADDLRVFLELDRRDEVAEEHDIPFDEREVSITFDRTDADMMRRRLKNEIEQYV